MKPLAGSADLYRQWSVKPLIKPLGRRVRFDENIKWFMRLLVILAWIGSGLATAMGLAVFLRRKRKVVEWSFLAGMVLLGLELLYAGLSYAEITPGRILFWQKARLTMMSLLPATWFLFSLTYARGNQESFLRRWQPIWLAVLIVPPVLAVGFRDQLFLHATAGTEPYQWYLQLGWSGMSIHLLFLLTIVLILMNLERTFRASVGTVRWRIKFMVLGLVVYFAARFYTSSQFLLMSAVSLQLSGLDTISWLLAAVMVLISMLRVGLSSQDVYPSQRILQYSLTGLLAGIYLFLVGIMAKLVTFWGKDAAFPLKAFMVLVALIGLTILLLSERVRQHARRFVSRHFHRPYYDYRAAWSTFTERTCSLTDRDQFSRAVVKWISDTFNVLSINLWRLEESRGQFVLGASTSIEEAQSNKAMPLVAGAEEFMNAFQQEPQPVHLGKHTEKWVKSLEQYNPQFFPTGTERVCVPLVANQKLLGLMTLADRVNYLPFTVEDLDLLKCVGDQVTASLLNFQLSERLLEVKEMEAFQIMSAFFVHDLKNTASTLNLMLQNLPRHFDDQAFREDALRGLSKSVTRINDLIAQLGLIGQTLQTQRKPADLNEVLAAALAGLGPLPGIRLEQSLGTLPKILIDSGQIQKVLANLLLNAVEAVGGQGEIGLETRVRLGWVMCAVTDNGCGMAPEFLNRSLFRPFQSTKKKGIGVGLFLSKRIVEGHGGKIEVESTLGKGTTFRILLPKEQVNP
jgi:putative PEP-CTERM system histidine kinase